MDCLLSGLHVCLLQHCPIKDDEFALLEATLRGGTPVYASPHVRQLFFKAKALPVTQRAEFLQQHPITHRDDFFALGATVLDMYAECGWRRGRSVAEVLESAGGSVAQLVRDVTLRVSVPEAWCPLETL